MCKPDDKIVLGDKTNFFVLNRNIARTPAGTKVVIVEANPGMCGIHGHFKNHGPTYAIRSEHGFIIGSSRDIDDLILLISEYKWHSDDIGCLLR